MALPVPVVRLPRVEAEIDVAAIDRSLPVEAIRQLVPRAVPESDQLDFKAVMYTSSDKDKHELAKDVCAFANHAGGLIVVGVADAGAVASALLPWNAGDRDVRHVRSVVAARTAPFPRFDAFVVGAGTDRYLLIAVAASPGAPHAVVTPNEPHLAYPVRNGTQTRWLSESELADRYRSRDRAARSQLDRLDQVVTEGEAELDRSAPWFYLATVPSVPAPGSINNDTLRNANSFLFGERRPGVFNRHLTHGINEVGIGRVQSAYRLSPGDPLSSERVELYADGCSFLAVQEDHKNAANAAFELGEFTLTDIGIALGSTAAEHAINMRASGDAVIEAGIVSPGNGQPMVLSGRSAGPYGPITGRLVRAVMPRRHTINLDAVATNAPDLLIAARMALTDVFQAFGVAEVPLIDPEGRLRRRALEGSLATKAIAWADKFGAEVV